jgi:polyhydroxybutyrate depolymerase
MLRRGLSILACGFLSLLAAACGDDSGSQSGSSGAGGSGEGGAGGSTADATGSGGSTLQDFVVGGDRPVTVAVPPGYDESVPAPLLVLLHGYSASGALQEIYLQLGEGARERGMFFATPDGTVDGAGNQFWNATEACCDFGGENVDDSAYLMGVVDEIAAVANIDPKRVYFAGHSNGGFMSYRMACDHADRIAAIVSLAGATFADEADCGATEPVSVLQIHGDADDTVPYQGGPLGGNGGSIPSAEETVARWGTRAGCDAAPVEGERRDYSDSLAGDETSSLVYEGCGAGIGVELWRIEGGSHIPGINDAFRAGWLDFLMAHPKP